MRPEPTSINVVNENGSVERKRLIDFKSNEIKLIAKDCADNSYAG